MSAPKHQPYGPRLGRAVKVLRAERDLSQERLGLASRLHRNYVGALERGESNPTFRILLKLARGLDMPLSELIARYETTVDPPPIQRRRRRRGRR